MKAEKITMLVTAKTYPTISTRYDETVCTAGITDKSEFKRIYPICYRSLPKNQRFKKYQWISCEAVRDSRDPRRESYKLISNITIHNILNTKNCWTERRNKVLDKVEYNLNNIIKKAYDSSKRESLCVFKPASILKFNVINNFQDTINKKREILLHSLNLSIVENLPYKFSYTFMDADGKIATLQLLDWEIYQLTRKLMKMYKNNFADIAKALQIKYFNEMVLKKDLYFFLGTNKYWHIRKSKNPFMIIGLFYPPQPNE